MMMIHYVGTLSDDGAINYYRPVYSKYDEAGSIIADDGQSYLNDGEVNLPIVFPELLDITKYKVIDGELQDLYGNAAYPFNALPYYAQIVDKEYFTKYEWLLNAHSMLFYTNKYKIWSNPDLYYRDVEDELKLIQDIESIGGVLYIVPHSTNQPYKFSDMGDIKDLYKKYKELESIENPLHATLIEYSNTQSDELEEMLDELIEAVRIYL
jgi:hypothetical protein